MKKLIPSVVLVKLQINFFEPLHHSLKQKNIFTAVFLILFSFIAFPRNTEAQVLCQGAVCSQIPLTQTQYALFTYTYGERYLNEIIEDMGKAGALAGASTFPIGTVNLDKKFSTGVSGAMALTSPRLVGDIYAPGVGMVNVLPSAGIAVAPRFFIGFNLGRLMGKKRDEFSLGIKNTADYIKKKTNGEETDSFASPGRFSPLRFDIYFSGLSHTGSFSRNYDNSPPRPELHMQDRGEYRTGSYGILIRYHLLESFRVLGPLFSFRGVSLGIGFFKTSMFLKYFMGGESGDFELGLNNGDRLLVDGVNLMVYSGSTASIPLEINSGIRLISILNLSAGIGASFQKGKSSMEYVKTGYAYLESDLNQALVNFAANPSAGFNPQTGNLSMYMTGNSAAPPAIVYLKTGVELNLFALKLSLDTYYAGNQTVGWNAGARIEF